MTTYAGANCFPDEHEWPTTLEDSDEILDALDGIEGDFNRNLANANDLAVRLIMVLEKVAAGDCLGCRNVACRISMLIEDLEAEDAYHKRS
jgi:hypothetical protein